MLSLANDLGREFHIDGLGTDFFQVTNQEYILTYNIALYITYIPKNDLENLSIELFSRHDEGGEPENRFGGVTYVFYLDTVESKVEYFHKKYQRGRRKN